MSRPVIRNTSGQINVTFPIHSKVIPLQASLPSQRTLHFDQNKHIPLKSVLNKIDRLVGLKSIKDFVYEIYAWLYITQRRKEQDLKATQQTLHMIFKGNPGTGKTTVSRILAELFLEMGVLSKGHLVEVERADLVGEYIGHTAQKTRDLMKSALGGILFIDEAYSLARGGTKDFGKEAIDCLVKGMEDNKDDLVIILAGYPKEMEYFLKTNPGLPSRFPIQIEFNDYTIYELLAIAEIMVEERDYVMSTQSKLKLKEFIQQQINREKHFSNARFVRNLLEKAIREHAVRLLHKTNNSKQDLMTLAAEDFVPLEG
jgi:stage V sporulation protein K